MGQIYERQDCTARHFLVRPLTAMLSLAVVMAMPVSAGTRTSASYSIAAETADGGGRKTTSASYSNDGSIGGIAGIGTVVSPVEIAKHGYIGQLYDVTGVLVTASPTTVNETSTRQLNASAALDDSTFLALAANQISWSIVTGPINSINSSGLATAGNVYQNTGATVRGDYQQKFGTLGLTVLNVGIDDFGIYASDGIDDAWQVQYFGENNPNAAPGLDPDSDGQNNGYEYIVGTVPTNAASRFNLTIANVAGQPIQKLLTFSPRLTDRTYYVEFRTSLSLGTFTTLTSSMQSDSGTIRVVTDTNAVQASKFYRVGITFP
ncbi:MAG: hypothetical protein HY298_26000 [Verrucomicrobia bacterium]|nr:hypothetical protein [Verrucomicrobiota bacterium]